MKTDGKKNVEDIFIKIKNVASVCPIATRNSLNYETSSTFKSIIFRKVKFKFMPIPENFEAYNKSLQSVNRKPEISKNKLWPVIEKNGIKAIVGSGHQVLTIRRELLFSTVPNSPCFIPVGRKSEFRYVDEPINRSGGLRLATYNNYAYHMGNAVEDWMSEVQKQNLSNKKNSENSEKLVQLPVTNFKNPYYGWFYFWQKVWSKLFKVFYNVNKMN